MNLSPSAQIFANHPELNNFGEDLGFDTGYTYRYSSKAEFLLYRSALSGGAKVELETSEVLGGAEGPVDWVVGLAVWVADREDLADQED